jgi:acetyl esterase/lipase
MNRLLTVLAALLALLTAAAAVCMVYPAWNKLGLLSASILYFPLHILVLTIVALILARVAATRGARGAKTLFSLTALLSLAMGLLPVLAIWREARRLSVPLSLQEYVRHGKGLATGSPVKERTVVFGTTSDGSKLELDVWRTGQGTTGPLRPAILMVHGGGWKYGTRSATPKWNAWLNDLGYEVFDVEYRMPPPVRWLDEVGDVKAALGWISVHAAEYHVDPARISIMGGSAGGNLAMLAGYSVNDSTLVPSIDVPPIQPKTVINFYGPSDMVLGYKECPSPDVPPAMEEYIGGSPQQYPERYRALSPITHVRAGTPPTITFLGTLDRLVLENQATLLDDAMKKAGATHEMYLLPANEHAFDLNWGGFATQIARAKVRDFLRKYDGSGN